MTDNTKGGRAMIDRVEVMDQEGRQYVKGSIYGTPVKVELSIQDGGRTLKVFVTPLEVEGMSKNTTDNTQEHMHNSGKSPSYAPGDAQELDEILDRFGNGVIEAYLIAPKSRATADLSLESGLNEAQAAIIDWHNKQTLELLDRLIAQQWSFGENDDALAVPTRYIEAERNKLKETPND